MPGGQMVDLHATSHTTHRTRSAQPQNHMPNHGVRWHKEQQATQGQTYKIDLAGKMLMLIAAAHCCLWQSRELQQRQIAVRSGSACVYHSMVLLTDLHSSSWQPRLGSCQCVPTSKIVIWYAQNMTSQVVGGSRVQSVPGSKRHRKLPDCPVAAAPQSSSRCAARAPVPHARCSPVSTAAAQPTQLMHGLQLVELPRVALARHGALLDATLCWMTHTWRQILCI